MENRFIARLAAGLMATALASFLPAMSAPPGFVALFNGVDLSGWRGGQTYDHRQLLDLPAGERTAQIATWTASLTELKDGKPHWRVEDGVLVNDGFGGYATTERDYGDFELSLEYKIAPLADSGVYLRGVPQIQIWDPNAPDPRGHGNARGSGGLWNNATGTPGRDPALKADRPVGEWNHLRVLMVGSRVSVWLNHQLVVDHVVLENYYDRSLPAAERRPVPRHGPVQLQTHGGETHWKNIFLREIGPAEAVALLSARGGSGFQRIFNGQDLTGWAGATDSVDIRDGALVWRPEKGGVLFWNTDLADFRSRLQFKLPKAGNNGLAIRYPGTGSAAYDGLCEIQVLDDQYELNKPAKLDPRQVHGSAYGMVAAERGYQNPIGEWNFQDVTVHGSRVRVELNGTPILDTDLSQVDLAQVLDGRPHPGLTRTHGFFGFAGHNDPVSFREIAIKALE